MLLACCHWDPRGLARRLPSLGAGAWRGASLLPWRVQCPGRLCAALAAISGGSGRYLVSCLPRFPPPRVLRCVWRAVLSGCPLPSLAGTPFHAVCAFCRLGPVALLVFPACPLCVCALALPRRPSPPSPSLVGVARAPRAVPVLGAGRAVQRGPSPSACPASVPCSVWLALGGGAARSRLPPTWLGAVRSPWGGSARLGRSSAGGWGGVGGWPVHRAPRMCGRGGEWGGGSPCLGPSLCFPWAGNKAGVLGVALSMEGVAPILLRFVLACCPRARSVWRPGVLARVCLFFVVPAGAGGWGVGAGGAPASLSGAAVLPGGGRIIPSASGGVGAGAPVACGPVRGVRGQDGGVAPWPTCSLSGGGCLRLPTRPPFCHWRIPPWRTCSVGVRPAASGLACRGGGGGVNRPP